MAAFVDYVEARVMMVRPRLCLFIIYIYFFFLIHHTSSASPSTPPSRAYGTITHKPSPAAIACKAYTRCRHSTDGGTDDGSILQAGDSRMGYGGSITSSGGSFTVGFFVSPNNTNVYLGTWYGSSPIPSVIVWVANRDNPIPYGSRLNCSLNISAAGNAVLLDSNTDSSYWSTAVKPAHPTQTYLRISDTGNLELMDRQMRIWQSFDHPTDTFLPGMDFSQGVVNLTSWKTPEEDPATGSYSLTYVGGELLMTNSSSVSPYWSSHYSSLHPQLLPLITTTSSSTTNSTLRVVMNATGRLQLWESANSSIPNWEAPNDQCDSYDAPCHKYGVCNAYNAFKCSCLPGYVPSDPPRWKSGDFTGGCSKKTTDPCGQNFFSLPMLKLPNDTNVKSYPFITTLAGCRNFTLSNNCANQAFSFDANNSICLIWTDEITRIQEEYYNGDGHMLYIRVNASDIDSGSRTCDMCGTNVIPYPLSTNGSCGDPNYFNFTCNDTNGQLYFMPPSGRAYKVSHINQAKRMFTVQLVAPTNLSTDYKCNSTTYIASNEFRLDDLSAFSVTTNCSIATLVNRKVVEVAWKPPLPPTCNTTADCQDWRGSTCNGTHCACTTNGFEWDSLDVICSKSKGDDHRWHMPLLLKAGIASAAALSLLSAIVFVIYLRRTRNVTHTTGVVDPYKTDEMEDIDLPFFDYESILVATDNFSEANKLGAGGFGPVYKGLLVDGNEVAVKRLATVSVQGVEEFRNEIIVIAKLQHRNLVRVVGYCIKADEKILIYEYMPNKSLDFFLFDKTMSPSVDWMKRFDIIVGIARGLLYLHQDSRLRIIHRDLKPSNILLDEELKPKISDFGLAKIVAGNEIAASTARVAGTYGYMSPEYALDGYFSIKSDVYSFGIIVFEVISGRRCTSLLQLDNNLVSLLGYAWAMWGEGRELELADQVMECAYDSAEVKRCINVAFLCVQEDPSDRPTMSSALSMLGGDGTNLPPPKQPVFVARRKPYPTMSSSSSKLDNSSNVDLTVTLTGR